VSPSLSWLDSSAIAARVQRLAIAQPPGAARTALEPRPFVGSSADREVAFGELHPRAGSLKDRLESFLDWTLGVTHSRSAFVIDAEGLVLAERQSDSELIAIASTLAHQLHRLRSCLEQHDLGTIAVDLDASHALHLAEIEARLGRFAIGFVTDREVPGKLRRQLQVGLTTLMSEGED
jgi:hypothetical protein